MATELAPGEFTRLFSALAAEADVKMTAALSAVALVVERQAKINASNGEHPARTKTPASPGTGPARVSGTLVRSITHSDPQRVADGWEVLVGMAAGQYPPYDRRTPANLYAYYLEVTGAGKSRVKYPFLGPAFDMAVKVQSVAIFEATFGAAWGSL